MKDKIGKLCFINHAAYKELGCNFYIPIKIVLGGWGEELCQVYRVDMCDIVDFHYSNFEYFKEY